MDRSNDEDSVGHVLASHPLEDVLKPVAAVLVIDGGNLFQRHQPVANLIAVFNTLKQILSLFGKFVFDLLWGKPSAVIEDADPMIGQLRNGVEDFGNVISGHICNSIWVKMENIINHNHDYPTVNLRYPSEINLRSSEVTHRKVLDLTFKISLTQQLGNWSVLVVFPYHSSSSKKSSETSFIS